MSTIPILDVPKGRGCVARLSLAQVRGVHYVDLRLWMPLAASAPDVLSPTKQGCSVPLEKLPELIQSLLAAQLKARELGWMGADA